MTDLSTQRYRYNPEPPYQQDMPGWRNVEKRTFESPDHVPEGEGWVIHPDFVTKSAEKPQISPVVAILPQAGTYMTQEIPAAGEAPKRRGRPAKAKEA